MRAFRLVVVVSACLSAIGALATLAAAANIDTVVAADPGAAADILYYDQDFEGAIGSEWSSTSTRTTSASYGSRRFLGDFANKTVKLTLTGLAAHNAIDVSFDLFIINTWDGNSGGPDFWTFKLDSTTLMRTTFSVHISSFLQSYPDSYPASYAPQTGAVESGTLGLGDYPEWNNVYRIAFQNQPHMSGTAVFTFQASGLEGYPNETWGIDNVSVRVIPAAPPGSGTQADPYQISELGHLVWMGDTVSSSSGKYYKMTADIDASPTATWNDDGTGTDVLEGFKPIGFQSGSTWTPFKGNFDGDHHTISGLTIRRPGVTEYIGLFGAAAGYEIRNVALLDCLIIGGQYETGGLVAYPQNGSVSNCSVTGSITGGDSDYASTGGLIGAARAGSVVDCWSASLVNGGQRTGGLVGEVFDGMAVSRCYALGDVIGTDQVGGLIGYLQDSAVSECYAAGAVTGRFKVGGLVGTMGYMFRDFYTAPTVVRCYATGSVTGGNAPQGNIVYVGGLIGSQDSFYTGGLVSQCYSTGAVSAGSGSGVGGLLGWQSGVSTSSSYWDRQTSGQSTSYGGTGKTTAEMKQQATFAGWDFATVWNITENVTYPYLRNVGTISDAADLVVTQVTAPTTASEGDTVAVSWTVKNNGPAAATGTWTDAVLLSDDQTIGSDTPLAVFSFTGTLNANETYTKNEQVTLPLGHVGAKYLVVQTDSGNTVPEGSNESNNARIAETATNIVAPDLVVTAVTCPGTAAPGQSITVHFAVRNAGQGMARGTWSDSIYLSTDDVLDASDSLLATQPAPSAPLAPNGTYTADVAVTIPTGSIPPSGSYYLFVRADAQNTQGESNEDNNVGQPCQTNILAPDLRVTSAVPPTEGWTGQLVDVSWTVANSGEAPATGNWQDCVYLSSDSAIGNDTLLACLARPVDLAPGAHYDRIGTFTIPVVPDGNYWIVIKTDNDNELPEANEGNNERIVGPLPIHVTPCPDLTPSNLVVHAEETISGGAVYLDWVVSNVGNGPTDVPFWYDRVYLSADQTLSGDDMAMSADTMNPTALNPTEAYQQSGMFIVPSNLVGTFYVIVKADGNDSMAECDEGNNIVVSQTPLRIVPATTKPACLAAVDVQVSPPNPQPGSTITVSWQIKNTGDQQTGKFSIDHGILYSDDTVMSSPPDEVLHWHVCRYSGNLAPGESSKRISYAVTIPNSGYGDHYIFVWPDPRLQASVLGMPAYATIHVEPPPPVDLEVVQAEAVAQGLSGQPISVYWKIRNATNQLTTATNWQDAVILSRDASLATTNDNRQIALFTHSGALDFDQWYDVTQEVVLPPDTSGTYYLFAVTDSQDAVYEFPNGGEDNNSKMVANPINVTYAPPDLQIKSLAVLASGIPVQSAASGATVTVNWTVLNGGTGATSPGSWTDKVYLSKDAILDASDLVLATLEHTTPLEAGQTYSTSQDVTIPLDFQSSAVYILICTDADGQVYESDDSNNSTPSSSFEMHCGASDLVVSGVAATVDGSPPGTVLSGTTLTISWTVTNQGTGTTAVPSWLDRITLSTGTTPAAGDPELATAVHTGDLAPGQSYTVSQHVTIPVEFSATKALVFVCTDSSNFVYECDETNNCGHIVTTFQVTPGPSDLLVPQVSVRQGGSPVTSVQSGSTVSVYWTIHNNGPGNTNVSGWASRIYLSADATLDASDLILATVTSWNALAAGGNATFEQEVQIPISFAGNAVHIFVQADCDNQIYESNKNNNYGDGGPFDITWGPADLQMGTVVAAHGTPRGQIIDLSWSVSNLGALTTTGMWSDKVYLSADRWLSADDVELLTPIGPLAPHNGVLGFGQSYSRTEAIAVPAGSSGYLIVQTNATGALAETDGTNNVGYAALPSLDCESDLVVTNVEAPATGYSGQTMTVRWTVANQGSQATNSYSWHDVVYLSRDQYLDRDADICLGYLDHPAALAEGAAYDQPASFDARIPFGLTGAYYVFVLADGGNAVCETNEANNVGMDGYSVQVVLPPPTDLVVSDIVIPVSGTLGEPITVRWTVHNASGNPALGSWHDAVYISSDPTWSFDDQKAGMVKHDGPLAGGGDYTVELTAPLPGVVLGNYYIIVRTDVYNEVRETAAGEANNNTASTGTMAVGAVNLVLGTPYSGTLRTGEQRYFVFDAPAGETIRIALDHASPVTWSELYVRFGAVPTPGVFDFAFSSPGQADQQVLVPTSQEGQYYILARATNGADGGQPTDFSVLAAIIPFSATSVTPSVGGNAGRVTVRVEGARFDPMTTQFYLRHGATGQTVDPKWVQIQSPTVAGVTFDLSGAEPGSYNLLTRSGMLIADVDPDTGEWFTEFETLAESVLANAFQVVAGGGPVLETHMALPGAARLNAEFSFVLEIANTGTTDLTVPVLLVASPTGTPIAMSPGVQIDDPTEIQLIIVGQTRPDVLAPGEHTFATVYARATKLPVSRLLLQDLSSPNLLLDWSTLESYYHDTSPDQVWAQTWANFQALVGNTWGEFHEALRRAAVARAQLTMPQPRYFRGSDLMQQLFAVARQGGTLPPAFVDIHSMPEPAPGRIARVYESRGPQTERCAPCKTGTPPELLEELRGIVRAGGMLLGANRSYMQEAIEHFLESGEPLTYGPSDDAGKDLAAHEVTQQWFNYVAQAIQTELESGNWTQDLSCDMPRPLDLRTGLGLQWNGILRVPVHYRGNPFDGISTLLGQVYIEGSGTVTLTKRCDCNGCCQGVDAAIDVTVTAKDSFDFCDCGQEGDDHAGAMFGGPLGPIVIAILEKVEMCGAAQCVPVTVTGRIPTKSFHLGCPSSGNQPTCCKPQQPPAPQCGAPPIRSCPPCGASPTPPSAPPCCGSCSGDVPTVSSHDPNEKNGPPGYGDLKAVGVQGQMQYTIYFENVPTATATATKVTVTDRLGPDFDWRAFQLGEIAFGDTLVAVPDRRPYYYSEVALANGLIARVQAEFDIGTGQVTWTLTAVDPATGETPEDPLLGLLPPNDPNTHSGEGHVTFFVRTKATTTTGTEIRNKAKIVFDTNEPIETNEVFNTVDSGMPQSSVGPLPAVSDSILIPLTWSGDDAVGGSGLAGFTIYVSTDSGTYVPFLSNTTETTTTFQGALGHSYRFYSIARDNAGNVEDTPFVPDTTTTIPPPETTPPTLVGAESRKTHGGTEFGIPLSLDPANPGIECRFGGPTRVVATFNETIMSSSGGWSALPTDVKVVDTAGSAITVSSVSMAGKVLTINLSGVANASRATISFPGITDLSGNVCAESPCLAVLHGDVNSDGSVNVLDLILVRNQNNQPVTSASLRCDANYDGAINVLDLIFVRNRQNTSVAPSPCP